MSEAPETIFMQKDASDKGPMTAFLHVGSWPGSRTEYTRTDIADARIAELEGNLERAERALKFIACDDSLEGKHARATLEALIAEGEG